MRLELCTANLKSCDLTWYSSALRHVEQVIEEGLILVGAKAVEFLQNEENRFASGAVPSFQTRQKEGKMFRE